MPGTDLSPEVRLETHALLDRLTAPGPTFNREDARRLIELIPVAPRKRFSFTGVFKGRGPGLRGRVAGVGDVEMEGEGTEKNVSWGAPTAHKIGGYVIAHTPGQISIQLMWAETREDQTSESCLLLYDSTTREPQEMHISVQKTLTLLFIGLAYISYVPWKRPKAVRAGED